MDFKVHSLSAFSDNYIFILDYGNGNADVVDPGDASLVLKFLSENKLTLNNILCTHHHYDHIGGNEKLVRETNANVYAYVGDKDRIPYANIFLNDGQIIKATNIDIQVIHVPGHTSGHVAYYLKSQKCIFVGDCMFSLGCGRLFEGTAKEMNESLTKLAALPEETLVYFGHEYTKSNLKFAVHVDGKNQALIDFQDSIYSVTVTVPTTLGKEKLLNPFLKVRNKKIRDFLKAKNMSDADVFAKLRSMKDNFSSI